eukprot:SAG31_NODE_4290_length_3376_cov_6.530058_2_plen_437_part_00
MVTYQKTLLSYFDDWIDTFKPPVHAPVEVLQVRPLAQGGFELLTTRGAVTAGVVVVATATYQRPRAAAVALPTTLPQLHVVDYKRPELLPPGRVLVIGAGQSGCQVVEDLLRAGRPVSLSVGRCRTLPRRYRGRDVIDWQHALGLLDRKPSELDDPALRFSPGDPQMTGRDGGRTTVRLAELAQRGAQLLGRLRGCSARRCGSIRHGSSDVSQVDTSELGEELVMRFDGQQVVRHAAAEADRFLLAFTAQVDAYCASTKHSPGPTHRNANGDESNDSPGRQDPPPLEPEDHAIIAVARAAVEKAVEDEARRVGDDQTPESGTNEESEQLLSLPEVGCVVWATGFEHDFGWLSGFDPRLLDASGYPITDQHAADGSSLVAEGLYFCGLNWMNARKSGILLGVAADAEAVAASIRNRFNSSRGTSDGVNHLAASVHKL